MPATFLAMGKKWLAHFSNSAPLKKYCHLCIIFKLCNLMRPNKCAFNYSGGKSHIDLLYFAEKRPRTSFSSAVFYIQWIAKLLLLELSCLFHLWSFGPVVFRAAAQTNHLVNATIKLGSEQINTKTLKNIDKIWPRNSFFRILICFVCLWLSILCVIPLMLCVLWWICSGSHLS